MVSPWRHPKTGVFWFRQAVPEALRAQVGVILGRPDQPCWELKWTLKTHDTRIAKERMVEAMAKASRILEAARNGAKPLTDRQAQALAGVWYQRQLRLWEEDPAAIRYWDHWDEGMPTDQYMEGTEDTEDPVERKGWRREWRRYLLAFEIQAEELLASEGVVTDQASKERLAELLFHRLQQAMQVRRKRLGGDYSPDPLPKTFPVWEGVERPAAAAAREEPASKAVVSLKALYDGWKAVAVVKPRSAVEANYAVQGLAAFVGHDDAAQITRDDLVRWRKATKDAGKSNNTWNNQLSHVTQVFAHGVNDGLLKATPATDLRLRKAKQKSPPPYSDADAVQILEATRKETRSSLRWAHWIMAFTGMRAAETLQLLGRDVGQDNGVWFIDINEDHPTKSVKTSERRRVPIHPVLVREGFLAYAQTIAPDAPVFPDKKLDRHGLRGGRAWNVIGKWARKKAGITDPEKAPDHSWRHRIEDELRATETPSDVRDAILGHSEKTMGRQYGVRGEALTRLHRHLSRVPVPPGLFPGQDEVVAATAALPCPYLSPRDELESASGWSGRGSSEQP